jgi:hypothetical protein
MRRRRLTTRIAIVRGWGACRCGRPLVPVWGSACGTARGERAGPGSAISRRLCSAESPVLADLADVRGDEAARARERSEARRLSRPSARQRAPPSSLPTCDALKAIGASRRAVRSPLLASASRECGRPRFRHAHTRDGRAAGVPGRATGALGAPACVSGCRTKDLRRWAGGAPAGPVRRLGLV